MTPEEELEQWRAIGKQLWPFVRAWGLCGAHPMAIQAVEEMAALLGITAASQVDANTALLSHKQTLEQVKQLYQEKWFRKMLRSDSERFLQELSSL